MNLQSQEPPEYTLGETEARKLKEAERAFISRPQLSIRMRIVAGFLLCFFLTGITALVTLAILYQARGKLQFLKTSQDITFEVLQARRFEKDFFLYGTNLPDAKIHAERALALLQSQTVNILDVVGEKNLAELSRDLGQYDALLGQCVALENAVSRAGRSGQIEGELRDRGSRVTDLAWALNGRESAAVDRMLTLSQAIPFIFLAILLVLIFWVAHLLAKTITQSLVRFQGYTRRIAGGDFDPIRPAKPYRDEFSDMAMAVNRMLFELRAREAQVLQAGKLAAVGTFTTGIAHELSNPLNNISITAEALMNECEQRKDERGHKLLADICQETDRANLIIMGLLDFIRQNAPERKAMDLAEVVESARQIVENEMALRGVRLVQDIPPGSSMVMGAPNELRQAFLNLFLNAIEAMPKGGTILVKIKSSEGGTVCLEVSDEGLGIPLEILPRVFDPFFTTKPRGKGTGLGLSICYGVIKRHGGDVQIESVEGRGTTVRVCLPSVKA